MKKLIPCILALAALVTFNYARAEQATDTKAVGQLYVHQLRADSIDASSIVSSYATKALGSAYALTNAVHTNLTTELSSNGGWVVHTNIVAVSATTNANVIGPSYFYGKSGLLLTAPTTGYSCSIAAPGAALQRYTPVRTNITTELGSNGVWVVTTNVVGTSTVYVPSATIGQQLTIVAETNMTFNTLTTVAPTNTSYTLTAGGALTVTPISGSQWRVLMTATNSI